MGKVLNGVLQGSILGPLLFNIFLNDILLSLQKCDLANYVDYSTLYTSGKSISMLLGVDDELQTGVWKWNSVNKKKH